MIAQDPSNPQDSGQIEPTEQDLPQHPGTPDTEKARSGGVAVAVMISDLVALALILTTFVAIMVCANPSAAVISAIGAAIAMAFRAWRKRTA
ncbi:hypothetical protein [Nocardia fluminea]|uniref:hypothetical protein n=1 Tax=Nocardia fluminea TaxID=134984 RepID=UPI003D0F48C0